MRNSWLIIKREYLERVRTRSFILSTLLLPAFMFGMMIIPGKMATMKTSAVHRLVVVSDDAELAHAVEAQLIASKRTNYAVEISDQTDDNARAALKQRVASSQIEAYLWAPSSALRERKATFLASHNSEAAGDASWMESVLKGALLREGLVRHGASRSEVEGLAGVKLESITLKGGREKSGNSLGEYLGIMGMVMMLYMTVLLYGMSVMRSVIEEKTSRVVEVMLSSLRPVEMMIGKVVGVGAVGLTQVLVWAVLGAIASAPSMLAVSGGKNTLSVDISPLFAAAFVVFFLLGYLFYSTLYATLGAIVNSDQEAQQWQMFVTLPIIVPMVMMTAVLRQPNAGYVVWMSLIPFFAPILMFARIVVQTPPAWQIVLSLGILMAAVAGALWLCSRVYRVGILMYGKRPTLPEILKWVRYA